jgi:hypothetical protein
MPKSKYGKTNSITPHLTEQTWKYLQTRLLSLDLYAASKNFYIISIIDTTVNVKKKTFFPQHFLRYYRLLGHRLCRSRLLSAIVILPNHLYFGTQTYCERKGAKKHIEDTSITCCPAWSTCRNSYLCPTTMLTIMIIVPLMIIVSLSRTFSGIINVFLWYNRKKHPDFSVLIKLQRPGDRCHCLLGSGTISMKGIKGRGLFPAT